MSEAHPEPAAPAASGSLFGAIDAGALDSATAAPPAGPEATAKSAAGKPAAACPAGMQLIAGEYCTAVEQKCLKSWFGEANKKVVCERFEPKTTCLGAREPKRFCVDTYEYPNRKGERPEVMNNFYQAQVKCAAQGKRLCTETEWTFACEGPETKPYPYGYVRDANKCRGDRPYAFPKMNKVARRDPVELERLWQGVPSGSQPECVSDFGVADLPGNADEVAASETYAPEWKGKFDSVTTGGPWYKGVRNQCRPKIYTHDEGFYYYYLSFRCCAEADGQTTDPRTPKQIKRSWSFEQVERLARLTVEQARAQRASEQH